MDVTKLKHTFNKLHFFLLFLYHFHNEREDERIAEYGNIK